MNRIGLKINGIWCVLPQDVSISIEEQNPLFSDSGSFSYPIEMSVSQNRELFKSIDHPHGRIRPQDLDGLPFELWYDGVMLLYGSTETDEDFDIEEDKCSINLVSGNGDFQSKIDGMQCTDVPLMGKVLVGHAYTQVTEFIQNGNRGQDYVYNLEEHFMMDPIVNVATPYDAGHPYCNARICVKRTDDYDQKKEPPYWVYEADRPWSGICFYVAYFLDCLFNHLGKVVKVDNLDKVEDMLRLAFFTTKCQFEYGESTTLTAIDSNKYYLSLVKFNHDGNYNWSNRRFTKKEVYATSKNFPEADVSQVVESLFNAFGLKVFEDPTDGSISLVYIRDILRDNEVIDVSMKIRESNVAYGKILGVTMTYGGDDKDTAFNYSDWSRTDSFSDYKTIIKRLNPYDKTCYVSQKTGDKYRIKIDSEAESEGNVKELNPSLFKVAQFNDFIMGEDTEDNEEMSLGFSPIIENDVTGAYASESDQVNHQVLAAYIDVDMIKPEYVTSADDNIYKAWEKVRHITGTGRESGPGLMVRYQKVVNYDRTQHNESPLQTFDSGFTLGVMRGPGNDSGMEVVIENYDGNGNDAWVPVADDYAFTADTMDSYGNHYDYNGEMEGGVSLDGRISLYTHVQTERDVELPEGAKPWNIDSTAAKRGLADRFMSEYMYFLLHRKTVSMDVDTTLSHLTSLSWFKQLRISDTVGRLKSRSYTLTNSGVTDMSIELYTIN